MTLRILAHCCLTAFALKLIATPAEVRRGCCFRLGGRFGGSGVAARVLMAVIEPGCMRGRKISPVIACICCK